MALVQISSLGESEKMLNVVQQPGCVIVPPNPQSTSKNNLQNKRPLAPMPTPTNCKRKIQFYQGVPQQPASVARRNARERNRVKQVNNGFAALRQHIPPSVLAAFTPQDSGSGSGSGRNKKLSKVETLKLAVEYIRSLQRMLDDHESEITTKNIIESMAENARFYNADSPEPSYSGYPVILPTPPSSETSASPTPSQTSDGSYSTTIYVQESYPKFEPKSPEDDELLDAIFSWQQNE